MSKNPTPTSLLGKIAQYTEQLAHHPRSTAFVHLAEAYRQMGLLDDALSVAVKGVGLLPDFAPGYGALGRIHAQKGNLGPAAEAFEKALTIEDKNLPALKGLARVRMLQGDNVHARALLQKAATLKPGDAALGRMLSSLPAASSPPGTGPSGPPHPQMAGLREEATLSPEGHQRGDSDPISTVTIAEIYIKQGFLRRALRVYRDILHVDPGNEEIRRKLIALKKEIKAREQGGTPKARGDEQPGGKTAKDANSDVEATTVDPRKEQLAVFSRWLDAIRLRRDNVR